jgi:hypothetical protein
MFISQLGFVFCLLLFSSVFLITEFRLSFGFFDFDVAVVGTVGVGG